MLRAKSLLVPGIVLLASVPVLSGQVVLFHAPNGSETAHIRFSISASDQDAPSQPASFDSGITIILDSSVLNGSATQALNAGFQGFFPKTGATALDMVALHAGEDPQVVHAATRQQFLAAMKTFVAGSQPDEPSISFTALLDYLKTFPTSGPAWKQVVFTGPEPAVPAAVRDYAYGILIRTLAERRIRLSHFRPGDSLNSDSTETGGSGLSWSAALVAAGGVVVGEDPAIAIGVADGEWIETKVPDGAPPAGFRVAPIEVRASDQTAARAIPWIWSGDGKPLPSLVEYGQFLERRAGVSKMLAEKPSSGNALAPEMAANPASELPKLLALNPYDPESLNLATDFAERMRDYASATRYAARIAELEPANGPNFARLGFFRWQTGDAAGTERELLRARELHADHAQSAAILGDIRSGRKDYPAAAADYAEAVKREPERVELWLKLADTQQLRDRKPDVALALEEALKLKPLMWDRRTQIVDYFLAAGDKTQALRHLQASIPLLPADVTLITRFAVYAEGLDQPVDAIGLWSRVIELDRANEPAYYAEARLEGRAGSWDRALATVEAGVVAVSTSARLYALNVDALTALGRIDDARRVARAAADRISAPALFERTAAFEDRYGADSPRYYKSMVETMRAGGQPEAEWRAAAERGLPASIREQQTTTCAWFAALIDSKLCGPDATAQTAIVMIPGGTRALLFMARGPGKSSAKAFLADFSRTLATNQTGLDEKATEAYRAGLIEYFRLLAELKAKGVSGNGKTTIRLSLENNKTRQVTEESLALLGWRSRRQNGKLLVEPATKGQNIKRQDLASALAVDVVSMQENLQAGKEFVLEISDESVAVFPEEGAWQSQFYPAERYAGGFSEALVRKPEMASLYTALAATDPQSGALLVASGMKFMAGKYGKLLSLYSSCLETAVGRVQVPGGNAAEPIWTTLANASPNDPGRFFRALLDKDDGHLLRFYFLISQLDAARQHFFTASQKRTQSFYDVFRQSSQVSGRQAANIESASIEDLFRELPLDGDGRILFPGGPAVWLVARNQSSSVQATARRLTKISRVTTPEVEDDILLRLIRGEFTQQGSTEAAWQNFLAVVRVEAARPEPLDDASALLLTEKYTTNRGLYGYFTGLTGLEAAHFREVLSFSEKIQGLDQKKTNIAVGLFQAVLYLLSAAERSGRIAPPRTAALLLDFARAMNQTPSPPQWAHASLDFLGAYMDAAGASRASPSLSEILVPAVADQSIDLGNGHTVNPRETLRNSYARVLELQNVPPLDDLLKIHESLIELASTKGDPRVAVGILTDASGRMRDVEISKKLKLPNSDLDLLKSSEVSRFTELNVEFQKEVAKKKIDPKHLQEIADEYWNALAFRTVVALAGQVYAANFRPDDLLVADDTLFLRKHRYVLWEAGKHDNFQSGELDVSGETGGSRITGGFDRISTVAGRAAAGNLRNTDTTSSFVAWALLGSVRATDWSHVDQASLRSVAVQIHAAQDWLVLAASQPRLFDAVSTATYGLLSLNRRARLLLALNGRDWGTVWSSVSATDLFFLAGRLRDGLAHEPAGSPGMNSPSIGEYMASATGIPGGMDALGPTLQYLRRRPAPGMVELPPYEQIAVESFPVYLAERVSEFKVYLVRLFARQSLPAAALPAVAEAAARAVLEDMEMTNFKDWPAVLDAYEAFDGARLKKVMESL